MRRIWISLVMAGLLAIAVFAPVAGQDETPTEEAEETPTEMEEMTPTEAEEMTPTEMEETTPTEMAEMTPTQAEDMTPTPSGGQVPPATGSGGGSLGTGSALLAIVAAAGVLMGTGLLVRRRAHQA